MPDKRSGPPVTPESRTAQDLAAAKQAKSIYTVQDSVTAREQPRSRDGSGGVSPAYLAKRVAVIACNSKWGGGIRREHLRDLLGCDSRDLNAAIAIAVRWRAVDVAWDWVVVPVARHAGERAA
jgi:hypothetical protein